jgi:hypothetical protein
MLINIKGNKFDDCATYIKADYIDSDLEINNSKIVEPKAGKVEDIFNSEFKNDLCDNTETTYDDN